MAGSKPILVGSGQASVNVEVEKVTFDLVLDVDPDEYDEAETVKELAAFYGINASLISLEATVATDQRRQLSQGQQLLLRVVIAVAEDAGSDALSELVATVGAANSSGLSAALGANVTQATPAQIEVFMEQQSVKCRKGYWCSAANEIPCVENTYNNVTDAIDAGACKLCPLMSKSLAASTSRGACICLEGYYDNDPRQEEVKCVPCTVGSACAGSGITLALLPLKPGYTTAPTTRQTTCAGAPMRPETPQAASVVWARTVARARAASGCVGHIAGCAMSPTRHATTILRSRRACCAKATPRRLC